jgi:hypothetical protein
VSFGTTLLGKKLSIRDSGWRKKALDRLVSPCDSQYDSTINCPTNLGDNLQGMTFFGGCYKIDFALAFRIIVIATVSWPPPVKMKATKKGENTQALPLGSACIQVRDSR